MKNSTAASPPTYHTIRLEVKGKIAGLTLMRPDKLNSLDPEMLEELLDALGRCPKESAH